MNRLGVAMDQRERRRLIFIKHGYRNRIDPTAQIRIIKRLLQACFSHRTRLRARSEEFEAARYSVLILLERVTSLSRFNFWDGLQDPLHTPWLLPPLRVLRETRQQLREKNASTYDLLPAMNAIVDSVRSMTTRFLAAQFHPDEDWDLGEPVDFGDTAEDEEEEDEKERERDREYARYKCAAFLPVLSELVEEVLAPLSEKIANSVPKDGSIAG